MNRHTRRKYEIFIAHLLSVLMVLSTISLGAFAFSASDSYAANADNVYLTGTPGEKRIQVTFKYGDATLATKIVHQGDTLTAPDDPSPLTSGTAFDHWATGTNNATDLTPYIEKTLTESDINSLAGMVTAGADNLYSINANAVFTDEYKVLLHQYRYSDEANRSVIAFSMYTDSNGSIKTVDLSKVVFRPINAQDGEKLIGWEMRNSEGSVTDTYTTTEIVDIDEDEELYPILITGHWIKFDTQGAPKISSIFVENEGRIEITELEQPQSGFYTGYEFGGWYTDKECTISITQSDLNDITEDKEFYAKWVPRDDISYRVVHMIEGDEGEPGEGKYSFYESETCYGTVGDVIANPTQGATSVNYSKTISISDYHIPKSDESVFNYDNVNGFTNNNANVTITADGEAVKYVYWNRNRYKTVWKTSNTTLYPDKGADQWIKWGESTEYYDKNKKANALLSRSTRFRSNYGQGNNIRYYDTTTSFPQNNVKTSADEILNEATITWGPTTESYTAPSLTLQWLVYEENLDGVEYDDIVTVSGKSFHLRSDCPYIGLVSGYPSTHRWVGIGGTIDGFTEWKYKNSSGNIVDCPTVRKSDNWLLPEINGYRTLEVYRIRNLFDVSAKDSNNVNGMEDFVERKNVPYETPIRTIIPAYTSTSIRIVNNKQYTFDKWIDQDTAQDVDVSTLVMPNRNLSLRAMWIPISYNVTFDAGEGCFIEEGEEASQTKTVTIESGELLEEPTNATRTDYMVVGWFKDAALTQEWDFTSETIQSDITLYAKWIRGGHYRVNYYDSNNSIIEDYDSNLYYDGASVITMRAYRTSSAGSFFAGWSTAYDNSTAMGDPEYIVGPTFIIAGNTNLYAVYGDVPEDPGPVLTLHSKSASAPSSVSTDTAQTFQTERVNDAVTLPDTVSGFTVPSGYQLIAWNTAYDGSGDDYAPGDVIGVEADADLYAVYFRMADVVLKSNITGNLGDTSKLMEFTITLTGLDANTAYTTTQPAHTESGNGDRSTVGITSATVGTVGGNNDTITSDASGNATFLVKMDDDEVFVLNSLPISATYAVSDAASDHVTRYRITAAGPDSTDADYDTFDPVIARASDSNGLQSNLVLATATETVDRGDGTVTIQYSANRDLAVITGNIRRYYMLYAALVLLLAAEYVIMRMILKRRYRDMDCD